MLIYCIAPPSVIKSKSRLIKASIRFHIVCGVSRLNRKPSFQTLATSYAWVH